MRDIDDILADVGDESLDERPEKDKADESTREDEALNPDADEFPALRVDTDDILNEVLDPVAPVKKGTKRVPQQGTPSAESKTEKAGEEGTSPAKDARDLTVPSFFTVRGTKSWNTVDPYVIPLSENILAKNTHDIRHSSYFIDEPKDEQLIKNEVSKSIVKALRNPHDGVINEYTAFLHRLIGEERDAILASYTLDPGIEDLFLYHIGPFTFYRIIHARLLREKCGFCYRTTGLNTVSRFLPDEYLKETVLHWFEENINSRSLDFDSVHGYEKIKGMVVKQYQAVEKRFHLLHNALNAKIGPDRSISKEKLMRMKGEKWFGAATIQVFKRFLNRTIFS